MRFACWLAVVLGGCGLTLDLDPPDPSIGIDAGRRDAGAAPDAGRDVCEGAADGTVCDEVTPRICLRGLCVRSRCGDGFIDPGAGEMCEGDDEVGGDGCEPGSCRYTCQSNTDCVAAHPVCAPASCGDDHVCSTTLAPEGTTCPIDADTDGRCRAGTCVPATCGDGELDPGEECDPGGPTPWEGCQPDCSLICRVDADCSDGVACNGVEVCETRTTANDELRAECLRGEPPTVPACFECDPLTGRLRLRDADGDGFSPVDDPSCEGRGGDCDDSDPLRYPGAPDFEPGDDVDNDCDDLIDEDRVETCYRDEDRDTFGDPARSVAITSGVDCPAGTVPAPSDAASFAMDCDDGDPDVFPGQTAWFATSRCVGGITPPDGLCWDYNCDRVETRRWPRAAACLAILGRTCNDRGWSLGDGLAIPSCGASGTWTTCANLGLACLAHLTGTPRTQECH